MYKYIAKAKDGQVIKGQLDAPNRDRAAAMVSAMGLYLVSVSEGKKSLFNMPKRVGKKQISIMLRQMSSMINASIPIPVVLSVLRDDEKNPTLKDMLTHMHKDVTDGTPLSKAMAAYPKCFSPFVLNMVEMGEVNGHLDVAFDRIAMVTEKELKVSGKAKSALNYPIILLTLAIGMTIFLSVKVVPTFAQLFIDFGGELPGITKVMLAISDFLQGYWYVLILGISALVVVIRILWSRRSSRKYMERVLRKVPIYKGIEAKRAPVDLMATPAWLDDAGDAIVKALEFDAEKKVLEEQRRLINEELRTTSQRVNLFEKVKIPECKENIRVIRIHLGDESTAAVARGKIAKKRGTTSDESEEEVAE